MTALTPFEFSTYHLKISAGIEEKTSIITVAKRGSYQMVLSTYSHRERLRRSPFYGKEI